MRSIQLQIGTTWLFYAILVNLGDAVADEVGLPFDRISLEMLYRSLYHFTYAYDKGLIIDPVAYFAAPENQDLAVVKCLRHSLSLKNNLTCHSLFSILLNRHE